MKLNPDCIRDILLEIESKSKVGIVLSMPSESELLTKYDIETLEYHYRQCEWSGLIKTYGQASTSNGDILVSDLSPHAHQFLANIRSDSNWKETKEIANKSGSVALGILETISRGIAEGAARAILDQK